MPCILNIYLGYNMIFLEVKNSRQYPCGFINISTQFSTLGVGFLKAFNVFNRFFNTIVAFLIYTAYNALKQ